MRRFLLTLTFITISAWSQPAQQQAQQPLVVRVQTPPNVWMHLAELVLPGIIGFAGALIAVWFTQRHQRQLELHKAELAAKYKSQDNRWEFRKDVYVNLLSSITDCISVLAQFHDLQLLYPAKSDNPDNPDVDLRNRLADQRAKFMSASATFIRYADQAPLADIAGSVFPIITALDRQLPAFFASEPERATSLQIIADFNTARSALQDAGLKDLWGTPEE